jgi:hypothetical protein
LAQVALELLAQVTQVQLLHFHHSHQQAVVEVVHSIRNLAVMVARAAVVQVETHLKLTQVELAYQDKAMPVELTFIQLARFHQVAVAANQQQELTEHLVLVELAERVLPLQLLVHQQLTLVVVAVAAKTVLQVVQPQVVAVLVKQLAVDKTTAQLILVAVAVAVQPIAVLTMAEMAARV